MSSKNESFWVLQDSYAKDLLRTSSLGDNKNKAIKNLIRIQKDEDKKEKECIFYVNGLDKFEIKKDENFKFSKISELKEFVLENIRKVEISECKLKKIPLEILKFPRITHLNLENNKIFSIDYDFFYSKIIPYLRILNLNRNHIEKLKDKFYLNSENLEELRVSSNQIDEISPLIVNLKKLRVLHIQSNAFTQLPQEFLDLNLEEFSLDWFDYLDPPHPRILNSNEIIRKFQKSVRKSQNPITIDNFPSILTGKPEYFIENNENSTLKKAVYNSDLGMIKRLTKKHNYQSKIIDKKGYDIYNYALRKSKIKAFTILMNINDKFPLYSEKFGSSLHLALKTGNIKIIIYLIRNCRIDLEARDMLGNTPLHIAFLETKEPKIEKYHKIVEILLNENIDLNAYNKLGETPLLTAIKNNCEYPFLIAEAWNGDEVEIARSKYRSIRKKFDFSLEDKMTGKTCLHYVALTSYLGLTNLVLYHSPESSYYVDNQLRIPKDYKKKDFLVSMKSIEKQYRIYYRMFINQGKNTELDNRPLFKKLDELGLMNTRTISKIKDECEKMKVKKNNFEPKTRAFFSDLSQYKKDEGRMQFYSKYTSLRYQLSIIQLQLVKIIGFKNSYFGELLAFPKIHSVSKNLVSLFNTASQIRFLSFKKTSNIQKENIKILDGFVFIPLFKEIKIFVRYLEENGNIFNFKASIHILNSLKREILRLNQYPAEIRHQNLENFYFTMLSLLWSKDSFKRKEVHINSKSN